MAVRHPGVNFQKGGPQTSTTGIVSRLLNLLASNQKLRLQTDNVCESLGKDVGYDGLQGRNDTKDGGTKREQHGLEYASSLKDVGAESVILNHVFQKARDSHFLPPQADTEAMVLLVAVEDTQYGNKTEEANNAADL